MNNIAISLLCTVWAASGSYAQAQGVTDLEPLTIVAPREPAYTADSASSALKLYVPLLETPASVQVLTHQMIQDQKVTSLDEALANAAGVKSANNGYEEYVFLRGFQASTYLRDGFRIEDPNGLNGSLDLSNVDSIEILKGPAAVLYGRLEPGGVVSIKTKQAQFTPSTSLEQSVGSWGRSITALDTTGPVDDEKKLAYRLNLSYDSGNSWIDNVYNHRYLIAPTLEYRPNERDEFRFEASYLNSRASIDGYSPVPFIGTQPQFGDPKANPIPYYFNPDTTFVGLTWNHAFNADWSIKQNISHNQTDFTTPVNISVAFSPVALVNNVWTNQGVGLAQLSGTTQTDGVVIDLSGKSSLFGVKNNLLFGLDFYETQATMASIYSTKDSSTGNYVSNVNVPIFGRTSISAATIAASGVTLDPVGNGYYVNSTTDATGVYAQDQISVNDKLDLLFGLRWQNSSITDHTTSAPTINESALTPRTGLVWKADDSTSYYASYSENFGASNGTARDWQGNALQPEQAQQYEIGFKKEWRNHQINFTAALFDLTKSNMVSPDLVHAQCQTTGCVTSVGKVESQGLELTLQGEIQPDWNLQLAYTHDEINVVVGTNTYVAGSPLPFIPKDMFRLFTTYRLHEPALQGWKVGGGVTWQGTAPGVYTDPNTGTVSYETFKAPEYTLLDLMASYEFRTFHFGGRKAEFQLNVKNALDQRYYSAAIFYVQPGAVTYGDPLSVTASLRVEF